MDARSQARPRSKSGFSFKSDRSSSTSKSHKRKESLVETAAEKRKTHMSQHTKANPNAAITELQPVALALEAPTMGSLRSVSHTDSYGRPIVEPDLSNPTRSRWERPLDTIRSFEDAIDGEYRRRRSIYRADTEPKSARSSYYWGNGSGYDQRSSAGTFGGRPRDSYAEHQNYGPPPPLPPHHRFTQRHPSEPALGKLANGPGVYVPGAGNQRSDPAVNRVNNGQGFYPDNLKSRETLNTNGSSGSRSEPWNQMTNPSSENSSLEGGRGPGKPGYEQPQSYGYRERQGPPQFASPSLEGRGYAPQHGVPQDPNSLAGPGRNGGGYFQQDHQTEMAPPAVPPKYSVPRKTVVPQNQDANRTPLAPVPPNGMRMAARLPAAPAPQQRKSWLKRTFSRKNF